MTTVKKTVLLAIGLFLLFGRHFAQPAGSVISGIVQMKDGSPIPGVTVTASSLSLADTATVVTDDRGRFTLPDLALGIYKLTFDLEGFKTLVRRNVFLGQEKVVDLKIILTAKDSVEAVTILDPPTLIDFATAASGKTMTRDTFQALPRGRNFDSLLNVFPGVTSEVLLLGGTSVHGASGLENRYYIDGADTTSIMDGSPGQNVSFDFVDEVQVTPSGAAAEYAGAIGGVIRVITRSGSNEFHGEILGYYSGAPLRSEYRDILDLDINDDSKAVYYPYDMVYGMDDDHKFEGGFNLGGAIFKNKLWFFGSVMPGYYTNTRTTTHRSKEVREWKRTEKQMNFLVKLTAQPFRNLRLGAGVVNNFTKYKGDLANYANGANPSVSYDDYGFSYPNISGSFSADLTLGGSVMLNARAGYFRTNQNKQLVRSGGKPYYYFSTEAPGGYIHTNPAVFPDIPPQYLVDPNQNYTGQTRPTIRNMERNVAERFAGGLDLTYFLDSGSGEHAIKAGISWVRRGQYVDNTLDDPIVFLAWDRTLGGYPYQGNGRGKYGYYAVRNNDVTGPYGDFYKAYGNLLSLYLQDSWTVANRLTITFGVRAGSETIPSYATGYPEFENLTPIQFDLSDKIAPRLGVVWDVKGDSSLKMFGSYGIYHDDMKLKMAAAAFGGSKWKSTYYTLDTYEWDKIGINGYYPGRPLLPYPYTFDFRVPDFDIVDPDLKPMTQRAISLGLEKRLGDDLAFSMHLVNKRLLRAIEDIGMRTLWGEKFFIANPGGAFIKEKYAEARASGLIPQTAPDCPKAKREYNAISIALDKRFAANWLGGISYTFSSLRGNYSGLASGDVVDRADPYVEQYFDSWYVSRKLDLTESVGPLPGDRPHHFKAYGSYSFPFGITAGIVANAMSGTPTSTEFAMDYPGYLPYGRADRKRSPFLWFANFYIEYNLKLGRTILNVNLNVDNIFDVRTAQRIYPIYNQGAVAISEERIAQGPWDINDYKPELDPRYLMESDFYGPLTARLGLKFSF